MADYAALKAKIESSPYNKMKDPDILDALNILTIPSPQPAVFQADALFNAIDPAYFLGLPLQGQSILQTLTMSGSANVSKGTTSRAVLAGLFADSKTTLANLAALYEPYDNATVPWAETIVGIAVLSQPDLDNARAA